MRQPKLGLLDYMLKSFNPDGERDLIFIPVGINYDRVLEDRTLLRRLDTTLPRRGAMFALANTFAVMKGKSPGNVRAASAIQMLIERGFGGATPPTNAPGFNTLLLIVIFIWASAGFATVIFSAAIKGVPDSLIEAAKVDGATNRVAFYKVTLPYIRATIITVATTTTIAGLKAFAVVAATTGGNFGTSTIANQFYITKFVQGRDGMGSALAVVNFILVIPVVVMNRRAQRRAEEMMAA